MEQETKPEGETVKSFLGPRAKVVWTLVTKQEDKDGNFIKEEKSLLSTAQVSKMRIAGASGRAIYDFRHGKAIRLELNDAFITYTLIRPNLKGVTNE